MIFCPRIVTISELGSACEHKTGYGGRCIFVELASRGLVGLLSSREKRRDCPEIAEGIAALLTDREILRYALNDT